MKRLAVLGATGSIGTQTLDVAAESGGEFQISAVSVHSNWKKAAEIARRFRPTYACICDQAAASQIDPLQFPDDCKLLRGPEGIAEIVRSDDVDVVVAAMVGAAGLQSVILALEAGKSVALANKEALVAAGSIVTRLAGNDRCRLTPIDSEHSAVLQSLRSGDRREVRRIVLTASGGPFRTRPIDSLDQVTPEEALRHPTWNMGPKITVDSATMMNKALEIVEAHWLFDVGADEIEVLIHPQSIVHALVEFIDGSVIAQLSPPDMRLPIQYALTGPRRLPCPNRKLRADDLARLEFSVPDLNRFPALELGYRVVREGGTTGAVLNAANEVAVRRFLDGDIRFSQIALLCRDVMDRHAFHPDPELSELLEMDRWARREAALWKFSG